MEDTLLRVFTKGAHRYRTVAQIIFQRNLADTRARLDELTVSVEENPRWGDPARAWYNTAWARVHFSQILLDQQSSFNKRKEHLLIHRVALFRNNHVQAMRYLDACAFEDETRLSELYAPLPPQFLDDDRDHIELEKELHQLAPTPLELIEREFPHLGWRVDTVRIRTEGLHFEPLGKLHHGSHQLYYACLSIMQQCRECGGDACYFYYAAFLDLFWFGLANDCMSDDFLTTPVKNTVVSPFELYYPHDTRAFTCWDLPDLYHVLFHIPLKGVQRKPKLTIEKYLQKSLPFCCQGRGLVEQFCKTLDRNEAAGTVILRLFWCMLANMYPNTPKTFNMWRLVRAREITNDKERLLAAFRRTDFRGEYASDDAFKEENFKGCGVVVTAFRLWVYTMTYPNKHYAQYAAHYINWDAFVDSIFAAQAAVEASDIFERDIFAGARNTLPESKVDVYRYRKLPRDAFVLKYLREALEKNVLCELDAWKTDREKLLDPHFSIQDIEGSPIYDIYQSQMAALTFCDHKIAQLGQVLPADVKSRILNTLLLVPAEDRLKPIALSMLCLPRFGGVSRNTILILLGMLDVYEIGAKPREIRELTGFVESVYELKLLFWYMTVVTALNCIRFFPLDAPSVANIHRALIEEKYELKPGQTLSPHVYEVFVTICCGKIITMEGSKGFGHENVYFDAMANRLMCAKTYKQARESTGVGVRKKVRILRKDLSVIPCSGSPVLRINLQGWRLVYGNTPDTTNQYMHCPRCGSFHRYRWVNWSGSPDGRYRCGECKAKEPAQLLYFRCWQCQVALTPATAKRYALKILSLTEYSKLVYYCKKHHNLAKRYTWIFFEDELRHRIAEKETKKNRVNR